MLVDDTELELCELSSRLECISNVGTNPCPWREWLFDRVNQCDPLHILELGSGSGSLWADNLGRLGMRWEIVISDVSARNVERCKDRIGNRRGFEFKTVDAHSIPYPDDHFDVVIADHLLHRIANPEQVLREIRRVLRWGGKLLVSAIGKRNLLEMEGLVFATYPFSELDQAFPENRKTFSLDTGVEFLRPLFHDIRLECYSDTLVVTDGSALVDSIYALNRLAGDQTIIREEDRDRLRGSIDGILAQRGAVRIHKDTGLFTCG
jgi:SAM-dependent methyltransferase